MAHRHLALALAALLILGACGGPQTPSVREPQTISFPPLADRLAGDPAFEADASASSGLPIAWGAVGVCTIVDGLVSLTGVAGSCAVTASQAGDERFRPASDVVRSFLVTVGFRQVGFVLLSETGPVGGERIDASAAFFQRTEPTSDVFAGGAFGTEAGTCHVSLVIDPDPQESVAPEPVVAGTPIHAGSPLTIRASGSAYAELVADGVGAYGLASAPAATRLPVAALTIDLPGADFAAFVGAAFADTSPLALDPGFDAGNVTPGTTFAWEPGGADSVAIFVGGGSGVAFSCVVPDDGSFAFDDDTRAQLEAAGFAAGGLQAAGRLSVASSTVGTSALVLGVLRLEALGTVATSGATFEALIQLAHDGPRPASAAGR
jgi:hypothetical protein